MKLKQLGLFAFTLLVAGAHVAVAQEWGTVKGRFVIDGTAPKLEPLPVTKDQEFCGPTAPDPTIQVGESGGLKNVALWLYLGRGDDAPPVHPSYAEKAKEPVVVGNKDCLYVPHVAVVQPGQEVHFANQDPIPHNFKVEGFANSSFNNLVPINGVFKHKFDNEERYPMNASCSIHPWMSAKIIVREVPYVGVSGEDGTFVIENLPVGKHQFQVWHEVPGNVKEMELGGKTVKDRRGLIEVEVKPGENDLGDIKISASTLK